MDKQPLNTGEQKDMTEFFTDLIGKIEEMSPALVRSYIRSNISNTRKSVLPPMFLNLFLTSS